MDSACTKVHSWMPSHWGMVRLPVMWHQAVHVTQASPLSMCCLSPKMASHHYVTMRSMILQPTCLRKFVQMSTSNQSYSHCQGKNIELYITLSTNWARLNIAASGLWGGCFERTFDASTSQPVGCGVAALREHLWTCECLTHMLHQTAMPCPLSSCYKRLEKMEKRAYGHRAREVEHTSIGHGKLNTLRSPPSSSQQRVGWPMR